MHLCTLVSPALPALPSLAGRETLFEEDMAEEEVEDELSPLSCQLAFVLGRLGRLAEASELYDKMIRGWVRGRRRPSVSV